MNKPLIIVFAKNLIEGRVKTRLARSIGDFAAMEVYKTLLEVTELATTNSGYPTWVYYSQKVDEERWPKAQKFVQSGADLGQKMMTAFDEAFKMGYTSVVLIGSDLPGMNEDILKKAFEKLQQNDVVFGPAEDGGYYLIGLNKMLKNVFTDKPWSQESLLQHTLQELQLLQQKPSILEPLNDIDTVEDLNNSETLNSNKELRKIIAQLNA